MSNCLHVSETSAPHKKVFWRKVLEIYATSIDYNPMLKALFFKQVQNKMHWVAHKRADAEKENMGLTLILLRYTPLTKNQCLCLSALL